MAGAVAARLAEREQDRCSRPPQQDRQRVAITTAGCDLGVLQPLDLVDVTRVGCSMGGEALARSASAVGVGRVALLLFGTSPLYLYKSNEDAGAASTT